MGKPTSFEVLLNRYKENKHSIKVQVKKCFNKKEKKVFNPEKEHIIPQPEPLKIYKDPNSKFHIIQDESNLYIGVLNFKSEINALLFTTTLKSESIIHTFAELPYVENVLRSRGINYKLKEVDKIKNPDTIGAKDTEF